MNQHTLFDTYIAGNLELADKLALEKRLAEEDGLKEALDDHIKMQASLDILLEDDVMNVIEDVKRDVAAKKAGGTMKCRVIISACVLALALVLGYHFLGQGLQEKSPEDLMLAYYKAPISSTVRGDQNDTTDLTQEIAQAHTSFQNKDYTTAALQFDTIYNTSTGIEKQRAQWFLALSLLDSDVAKSKSILESIVNDDTHIKLVEAKKLLLELSN